jgi:hypothetical protein
MSTIVVIYLMEKLHVWGGHMPLHRDFNIAKNQYVKLFILSIRCVLSSLGCCICMFSTPPIL